MNHSQKHDLFHLLKYFLLIIYVILTIYSLLLKKTNRLYSTILLMPLGFLLIYIIWPRKYVKLFNPMFKDNLQAFKNYLITNKLKPSNIHKIVFISGRTPILYAMERDAYNIFKYLIENNYDLNYNDENTEPPITFAAHSANVKYMQLLLKNKNKINLDAINKKFGANALEIAVWRGKTHIVELLLNAGMKFSVSKYNTTRIGALSLPFEKVSIDVKNTLVKRYIFNKTVNQLNMVNEMENKNKKEMGEIKNVKIIWDDYLQFA